MKWTWVQTADSPKTADWDDSDAVGNVPADGMFFNGGDGPLKEASAPAQSFDELVADRRRSELAAIAGTKVKTASRTLSKKDAERVAELLDDVTLEKEANFLGRPTPGGVARAIGLGTLGGAAAVAPFAAEAAGDIEDLAGTRLSNFEAAQNIYEQGEGMRRGAGPAWAPGAQERYRRAHDMQMAGSEGALDQLIGGIGKGAAEGFDDFVGGTVKEGRFLGRPTAGGVARAVGLGAGIGGAGLAAAAPGAMDSLDATRAETSGPGTINVPSAPGRAAARAVRGATEGGFLGGFLTDAEKGQAVELARGAGDALSAGARSAGAQARRSAAGVQHAVSPEGREDLGAGVRHGIGRMLAGMRSREPYETDLFDR